MPEPSLAARVEQKLAVAGFQVAVEESEGRLTLNGIVDSEENRQAALDIASDLVPDTAIEDNLEVEVVLPSSMDELFRDEPQVDQPGGVDDTVPSSELEPDFTDQAILRDPDAASGSSGSYSEDPAAEGDEVYSPPADPVVSTDAHGAVHVLGGFGGDADESVDVARSAEDNQLGDEAIADAIRRELREDASTTDLQIVVAVRRGVAHLRGQVPGMEDAENAEAVASRVPGVREVVEELDVTNV
jgi:osmotically-inducible protein OsmY